jgi:hypothetical protein
VNVPDKPFQSRAAPSGVQPFPEFPLVADAPDSLLDGGHLWLQEHVLGASLRFRVTDRGLEFGDDRRWFEPWNEPLEVSAAVRWVRERFDRAAFEAAVASPTDYEFHGVAPRHEGIDYEWDRLPAFLGLDVCGPDGRLPVDRATSAFDRLGLDPVNSFEREVPARHFQPARHEVPASAWYDGPAAGTLVRRKDGGRALIGGAESSAPTDRLDPEAFVDRHATPDAVEAATATLGPDPSVDAIVDHLLAMLVRERYGELSRVDEAALRDAAVERVVRR